MLRTRVARDFVNSLDAPMKESGVRRNRIPHFDEEKTGIAQCRSIYWDLLDMVEKPSKEQINFGPFYLRELYQTQRCDTIVKDFSILRNRMESYLSDLGDKETSKRILDFEANEEDKEKATQAVIHYSYWHRRQLRATLSWPQWFYYWTWFKAERMLSFVGLLSTGYTLIRFANYSLSTAFTQFAKSVKPKRI